MEKRTGPADMAGAVVLVGLAEVLLLANAFFGSFFSTVSTTGNVIRFSAASGLAVVGMAVLATGTGTGRDRVPERGLAFLALVIGYLVVGAVLT